GQRARINPGYLIDLGAWLHRALDLYRVNGGADPEARLVRGVRIEHAECPRTVRGDAAAEFLVDLARERRDVALAGVAFAARLHEGGRAALAHKNHAPVSIPYQCRHQAADVPGQRHGTFCCIAASQCWPSKNFGLSAPRSMSSRQRALTSILSGSERGT